MTETPKRKKIVFSPNEGRSISELAAEYFGTFEQKKVALNDDRQKT